MRFVARGLPLVFATAIAGLVSACNADKAPVFSTDAGTECTAGDTEVCECPPQGLPGVRVCQNDGTWGDCDCTNEDPCGDAVILVVDRSGSMGSDSKWTDFVAALEGALSAYDDQVEMGMVILPDETCDPEDNQNLLKLCRAPTNVAVDVGPQSLSTIVDKLEILGTCGGTPTAGALEKALDAAEAADQETQVILITDGLPNCNLDADGSSCECAVDEPSNYCEEHSEQCIDTDEATAAAAALYQSGAPVHVLGYTIETSWISVMDAMAEAGGTEESDYCPNTDSLAISLERILNSITDC